MTQEQANWEWMDARVKKLEEMLREYTALLMHKDNYIKHLEEGLESCLNLSKAQAEGQEK